MGHISCTKTKDANNSNFMKHGKRSDDIEVDNRKDICKIIKIYQKVWDRDMILLISSARQMQKPTPYDLIYIYCHQRCP
jgi:hypothetical protein